MFTRPSLMRNKNSKRPRCLRILLSLIESAVVLTVVVSVVLAVNTITIDDSVSDWSDETCQNDKFINKGSNYYDDETNQNDATKFCAASNHVADPETDGTILYVMWQWDDTDFSGANTGDGCALFDTDKTPAQRGNIDMALCNTISTNGTTTIVTTLYSCNDSKPDRCAGKSTTGVTFTGSCALDTNATDPWSSRSSPDCRGTDCGTKDIAVECSIPLTDIGLSAGDTALAGMCTYPSEQPNSNPKDCTFNPTGSRLGVNTDTGENQETDPQGNPTAITLIEFRARGALAQPVWLPAAFISSGLTGLLGFAGIGLYIRKRNQFS